MRRLTAKLRSRRGASITFALLLFLVCAIVSGVVVVAASTVGGRMSGMRETDQRYYGATIAASKLQEIFESTQNAKNESEKDTKKGPVLITYNKDIESGSCTIGDTVTYENAPASAVNAILAAASKEVVKAALPGTTAAALEMKSVVNGAYTCTITPTFANGLLNCAILVTGPSDNTRTNGAYKLSILFTPNLKVSEPDESGDGTATVSWKLNSLSKGRATVSGG